MADLVLGAMGSLILKLGELLIKEEYKLQTRVKERISSLTQELEVAQATLRMVAEVPWDQLDEPVQLWARQVRESSYNMEDVLDMFLVLAQQGRDLSEQKMLLKPVKKMIYLWKNNMARREISVNVEDIMSHLQEVTERCSRYKLPDIMARPATALTVDPRLHAMYHKVKNLVGISKPRDEVISKLQSNMKMKILSIVGVGGLGKTTLAKAVYDKLKGDYHCRAFVPVGRDPDLKKVLKDILIDLNRQRYLHLSIAVLDEWQLINEVRNFFLEEKERLWKNSLNNNSMLLDSSANGYFIVIDDIWDIQSWQTIKLAFDDENNYGGRIIITTRKMEVAREADEVYKLQPLPPNSCRELFFTRISGHEGKYVDNQPDEISDKFIRKCGGIPLAIITMASLLAGKQRNGWSELYKTIDFGRKGNKEAEKTMRILSFSYYDMPSHLRTCLLYLSAFPEDSFIPKVSLVWKWVAEGFVREEEELSLFETGEGYFNDLINRSMIQAVESDCDNGIIDGCRVHDMVLDFIRSISREENFFTVFNNGEARLVQSNELVARRLAHHNWTMGRSHKANNVDRERVRSFIAQDCVSGKWVRLSSFKLLRVLAIEKCNQTDDGWSNRIKHLGHLIHLRFLGLSGTRINKIPEEIGALSSLQTLDLWESYILELPPSCSLPKQLLCLRITFDKALGTELPSLESLTSLEELSIDFQGVSTNERWLLKQLCSLRELRVLNAYGSHFCNNEEDQIHLMESLCHLHDLRHLSIQDGGSSKYNGFRTWEAPEFFLPRHLQHLDVVHTFKKLPTCINPSCVNLSHLELNLEYLGEQALIMLGMLPELRFLGLDHSPNYTPKISNISDSGYFPKLRSCRLSSNVVFLSKKQERSVSFHLWNVFGNIAHSSDFEAHDMMQRHTPTVSDDELQRPLRSQPSKLQHGLVAMAFYFLALFQNIMAFVKKWSIKKVAQQPLVSDHGSAPRNGDGHSAIPSVSHDEKKGFMQSLEVLHCSASRHPYYDNLGLENLPSLREIHVEISENGEEKVKAALRVQAQLHPNRPALHITTTWYRGDMVSKKGREDPTAAAIAGT